MGKRKLIVSTPYGTFTRSTHQNYSHIVVIGKKNEEYIKRNGEENRQWLLKEQAEYQARVDSGKVDPQYPTLNLGWYKEMLEGFPRRLKAQEMQTQMALERSREGKDFQVAGWAGRLDLAQKVAATVSRNFGVHDVVEIFPVSQEEVGQ